MLIMFMVFPRTH